MNNELTFESLNILPVLSENLKKNGITTPTEIQKQAIPVLLQGKSLLFQSETGTGKTFAYLLPFLTKILQENSSSKSIKLLIISPTVELASQIKTQVQLITQLKTSLITGGASLKRQMESLKEKPTVVICTPARVLDLINLKKIKLNSLSALVLDEADRLLSQELKEYTENIILSLNCFVQIAAASATIQKNTEDQLLKIIAKNKNLQTSVPETLIMPQEDILRSKITHYAIYAETRDKIDTLRKLIQSENMHKVLVFTSRIDQVANIQSKLQYKGIICSALHAKMDKTDRKSTMDRFRSGKCPILITSDLSSRGLDIPDISHIIQMDLPSNKDFFIHRAGRTGRAGKTGFNIVIGDEYEMRKFQKLEKKLKIVVYPRLLYKGKLIAPDTVSESSATEKPSLTQN